MCVMYYPESAIIASEYSHRANVIQQMDTFLFEHQGKPFYAGTAADALGIKLNDIRGILNLYKSAGVLTERKVWLCPIHGEEIDPVRDDVFHCPTCGQDYRGNQCKQSVLYTARRIEAKIIEDSHESEEPSVTSIASESKEVVLPTNASPQPQGDALVAEATVKAAKIGCVGVIIAAVIGGVFLVIVALIENNRSNGLPVSPTPTVIYTEIPTLTTTITVVPSATFDITTPVLTPLPSQP